MANTPKTFEPGIYLFREDDQPDCIYLILKGVVAIRKKKGEGEVELARVYSNEVIGELSFFDRLPRSASAVTITEVEAMQISFESLEKIYGTIPDYMKTIMASVADRLRKADDLIRKLKTEVVEPGFKKKPAGSRSEELSETAQNVIEILNAGPSGEFFKGDGKKKDQDEDEE